MLQFFIEKFKNNQSMFKLNGISKLIDHFEIKSFPDKKKILKTTIQVGPFRYRECSYLFFSKEGLFLKIKHIFKNHPVILIPWKSIEDYRGATLYGRKAIQLDFNDPSLPSVKLYEADIEDYYHWLKVKTA